MMRIKKYMGRLMHYGGISYLRSRSKNKPIVLAYHRINDIPEGFQFDKSLISATPRQFEDQILWLKKHRKIISLKELIDAIADGRDPEEDSIAITFDDGYLDNYTNAFPILKRHSIPATIFLSTGFIGTARMFWWDTLAFHINNIDKPEISTSLGSFSLKDKDAAIVKLNEMLKTSSQEIREEVIAGLAKMHRRAVPKKPMMLNWKQVEEMSKHGITFGSHTHEHSILSHIPLKKVEAELGESKRALIDHLGSAAFFSYPNGFREDYCQKSKDAVKRYGFRSALTYIPGYAGKDLYELNRVFVRRDEDMIDFKNKLAGLDILLGKIYLWSRWFISS
jgi:peptidoglycan/xylan/chitin deacetylase (PgdA/CDA1 family)